MKNRAYSASAWPVRSCAVLLLLLLGLTACSGSTAQQAAATTTTPATSTPASATLTPTPTPNSGPVDMQTAWGAVTVHQLPSAMGNNQVFVFENAATPDGQWLVGALEPRNFLTNTSQPSYLVLYNISSHQVQTLHALLTPQSQILSVSADDHWIVWSEASDQPNFFDWTLFAYNRQTGQVKQLAQAAQANGQAIPGPYPMPGVDQDTVLWNQVIGPISSTMLENAVVKVENLATGSVTTLATKAGPPLGLSWPWAMWSQGTPGVDAAVLFQNLNTNQRITFSGTVGFIALSGTSVAYTTSTNKSLFLLEDITRSASNATLITQVGDANYLQFIAMNNRLIGWTAYSMTPQVWDRAQHRLVNLPITNPESEPGTWVGGHLLVWADSESPTQQDQDMKDGLTPTPTYDIIDTDMLPTSP